MKKNLCWVLSASLFMVVLMGLAAPAWAYYGSLPMMVRLNGGSQVGTRMENVLDFGRKDIRYIKSGCDVGIRVDSDFSGEVQKLWLTVMGQQTEYAVFDKNRDGDFPSENVFPYEITIFFVSGQTIDGKTVDLSDPSKVYAITMASVASDGKYIEQTEFFRVVNEVNGEYVIPNETAEAIPPVTNTADSGSCGELATWSFDRATGTLTISGTGTMKDFLSPRYASLDLPWRDFGSDIKTVHIGNGITRIGAYAFAVCDNLTAVTLPDSVTHIGDSSFAYCKSLKSFSISKNIAAIASTAFSGCSNLETFYVEPGNTKFRVLDGVLYNDAATVLVAYPEAKGTAFTVPDHVQVIGNGAFSDNRSLISVVIPEGTTNIDGLAFMDCRALKSVTLPSTLKSIGNGAFAYCTTLPAISLPEGLTNIDSLAFVDNVALSSLSLPNSLISIGDNAFERCVSLTVINIPSKVSQIGQKPFNGCEKISAIQVAADNQSYCSVDGILYDKNMTTLVTCPQGKTGDLTIPAGVTQIGPYAFENCYNLRTVTLPESIIKIGERAFSSCSNHKGGLVSVNIPHGITEIEEYTFLGSTQLASVTLPEGLTSIGKYAFLHCRLETVVIPDTVTFIGEGVFNAETVLQGRSGGYAETYAKQNGMEFSPIEMSPITAAPTRSTVLVNGQSVAFDAYGINGNNYFKLRDLAKVLSGTGKQFEVTWDGKNNAINLLSGQPYTVAGGELTQGDGTTKTAQISTSTIYLDGQPVSLLAYNIGGNNYFKLRDVGQTLDFNVTWDGARNTIIIDTTQSYTPD